MGHEIDVDHMLFFKHPNIKRDLDGYGRAQSKIRFFSREEVLNWFDNNNTTVFFDYREEKIIDFVNTLPEFYIIVDFIFDFKKSDNPDKIFIETEVRFKF
tara:strand:- start:263 stop:562 length:300 start_codon:yes stop_codon:yes gene_type:complete